MTVKAMAAVPIIGPVIVAIVPIRPVIAVWVISISIKRWKPEPYSDRYPSV